MLGSAFFVAAEYSLVSSRKSRIKAMSRQGSIGATRFLDSLPHLSRLVAACQVGITMIGIGTGIITEPLFSELLSRLFGDRVDPRISQAVAFLAVSFILVELGELVPKYATLQNPERAAILLFRPLHLIERVFLPLTWLAEKTAVGILALFGVKSTGKAAHGLSREELFLIIEGGGAVGESVAEVAGKSLRFDSLAARDVMIHRLDVKWIDVSSDLDQTLDYLGKHPYSRLPVCRGDLDDVVGIVYVHDVVRSIRAPEFSLEKLARKAPAVPENLTLDRMLQVMRSENTQMLLVVDEYGGTSGIVTLEDLVEEVFGELEDHFESEQAPITYEGRGRVSARGEVRFDELLRFLHLPLDAEETTESLASIVIERLERVPKVGDSIEIEFGTIRVLNMARRRITRVLLFLKPEYDRLRRPKPDDASESTHERS